MFNMASTLSAKVTKRSTLVGGLVLGSNSNRHYQTMDDLLGASTLMRLAPILPATQEYNTTSTLPDLTTSALSFTKATSSVMTIRLR